MASMDGTDYVDPNTAPDPAPRPTTPAPTVSYDLLGTDPSGKAVYRGTDGQLYTDDPHGMNGFSAYNGTWPPKTDAPPPVDQPPTNQPPPPTGSPTAPTFNPPPVYNNNGTPVTSYTAPPAFNYADFVAPDPNKLNEDPLFKFTLGREQDAISKRAAAAGGLFTGGTYDALMRNAADISGAGYQRLYDRDLNTYQTNRGNAFQNYQTNYGTQYTDPYRYAYQGSQDAFNSQIHNFDQGRSYDWARTLFGEQQANDQFDRRYKIYSSL